MPRNHTKGEYLTGGTFPAASVPVVEKGSYLTGGPIVRRWRLPPDLQEFQSAADLADALGWSRDYQVLERWAREARQTVEKLHAKVRQR